MPGIPVFSLYSATHPPQADVSQAYQLGKGNRNNEILYQISKNKKIPKIVRFHHFDFTKSAFSNCQTKFSRKNLHYLRNNIIFATSKWVRDASWDNCLKKFNNEIREEFNLTSNLRGKTQDEEDSTQNFPLYFVFYKIKRYICTAIIKFE